MNKNQQCFNIFWSSGPKTVIKCKITLRVANFRKETCGSLQENKGDSKYLYFITQYLSLWLFK